MLVAVMAAGSGCGPSRLSHHAVSSSQRGSALVDRFSFQHAVFVCIDIQPGQKRSITDGELPHGWRAAGFTAEDVNAGAAYLYDIAIPNARRVADACRGLNMPMIFVHWGCLFQDGMDMDPEIRSSFLREFGDRYDRWPHVRSRPDNRPADELGVRDGEYVIPKTGQDAFASSNLGFVLKNLGARSIVFVGGHTGACLGKTAASARRLGYQTLAVADATFDARESTRLPNLRATGYDYIVTTEEFLALAGSAAR